MFDVIMSFLSWDYILSAAFLVQLALLFYCLGFLARDELWLRGFILIGTGFYLLYYYFIEDTPLWDAIFASGILGLVNFIMIFVVIIERTTFGLNQEETETYKIFSTLTPGHFRKILKKGEFLTAQENLDLCTQDETPDYLYLVLSGQLELRKQNTVVSLPTPMFLGEIAFLRERPASATVMAGQGARYLRLPRHELREMMDKNDALNNALIALFSYDLADKVGAGLPMQSQASRAVNSN